MFISICRSHTNISCWPSIFVLYFWYRKLSPNLFRKLQMRINTAKKCFILILQFLLLVYDFDVRANQIEIIFKTEKFNLNTQYSLSQNNRENYQTEIQKTEWAWFSFQEGEQRSQTIRTRIYRVCLKNWLQKKYVGKCAAA